MERFTNPSPTLAFACVCSLQLFFAACGTAPTKEATEPTLPPPAAATDSVVPRSAKGRAPNMDFSTPENVLATIKDIVATDALDSLKRLCDTRFTTGAPTLLICGMATENMDQIDKFRAWFASARIDSAAIMNADTALLPLTFSRGDPVRERHCFLHMVRGDGRWYLNNISWKR
jgi:hypothetical protein